VRDGRLRELAGFVQTGLCLLNRSVPCRNAALWLVGRCLFVMKMEQDGILALVSVLW